MAIQLPKLKLDCRKCTDRQKIDRGCVKDAVDVWVIDGEELRRCPIKVVTKQSIEYIRAFNMFEKGYLPNIGGWMNQSVKFLDAIAVIQAAMTEEEKK